MVFEHDYSKFQIFLPTLEYDYHAMLCTYWYKEGLEAFVRDEKIAFSVAQEEISKLLPSEAEEEEVSSILDKYEEFSDE